MWLRGDNKLTDLIVTYNKLLTVNELHCFYQISMMTGKHTMWLRGDNKLTDLIVTYNKLLTVNELHCFYQISMLTGKHTMRLKVTTNSQISL